VNVKNVLSLLIVLHIAVVSLYAHRVNDTLGIYVNERGDTLMYHYMKEQDSLSQDTSSKESGFMDFVEDVSRFFIPDTSSGKRVSFLVIPEFSYSDRSGIGIGGSARMYFRNPRPLPTGETRRLSFIDASVNFSFKGDMSFSVVPEFYLNEDKLLLRGYLGYGHYPSSFWGIGPSSLDEDEEQYDKNNFKVQAVIYKRIFHHMYAGVGYHFYDYSVGDKEEDGLLDSGAILGSDGFKVSGISAHFMYDTRDYQFVPMKGLYVQADGYYNFQATGSTTNFTKHNIDVRYYLSTGIKSVLAIAWYSQITMGDVPFQEMDGISNGIHSRGYPTRRYIDKDLSSIQAEYRYYVGRFGFAGFASAAGVGDNFFKALSMNKITLGGGVRFKLFRSHRMYFRADVGVSLDGGAQLYFGIDELF
jgi:hypothetical protein